MTPKAMPRVVPLLAALCLAACGSSGAHPASPTTTSSRPTTTRPTTPHPSTSTTQVNAVVADQFTQLTLMGAINAAQSIYRQSYDYTAVTPATLAPLVANVHFGALGDADKSTVGVMAQDRNDVLLVARSAGGRWYCVTANATDGLSYGEGTTRDAVDSNGECQAPAWSPAGG